MFVSWQWCTYVWPRGKRADASLPSLCSGRITTARGNKGLWMPWGRGHGSLKETAIYICRDDTAPNKHARKDALKRCLPWWLYVGHRRYILMSLMEEIMDGICSGKCYMWVFRVGKIKLRVDKIARTFPAAADLDQTCIPVSTPGPTGGKEPHYRFDICLLMCFK